MFIKKEDVSDEELQVYERMSMYSSMNKESEIGVRGLLYTAKRVAITDI